MRLTSAAVTSLFFAQTAFVPDARQSGVSPVTGRGSLLSRQHHFISFCVWCLFPVSVSSRVPLPASLCRRGSLDVWSRLNTPLFPLMVLKFDFEPRSLLFSFSWVLVTECRRQEEEERMKRLPASLQQHLFVGSVTSPVSL